MIQNINSSNFTLHSTKWHHFFNLQSENCQFSFLMNYFLGDKFRYFLRQIFFSQSPLYWLTIVVILTHDWEKDLNLNSLFRYCIHAAQSSILQSMHAVESTQHLFFSLSPSVVLSICLSVCLSFCLSISHALRALQPLSLHCTLGHVF